MYQEKVNIEQGIRPTGELLTDCLLYTSRKPVVDDIVGAYWTGTGICAHQSAMEGGTVVKVPEFKKYL